MKWTLTVSLLLFASAAVGAYRFTRIDGYSMHPVIKHNDAIVYADHFDFSDLQTGDVVIYRNGSKVVCHRLTEKHGDKWKAKGDNNRFADRGFVTQENYVGKVTHIGGHRV